MPDMTGFDANNAPKNLADGASCHNSNPESTVETELNKDYAPKIVARPELIELNVPEIQSENQKNEPFCFLNVYKPRGITSFDVIYKLRRILKIKKIGHSGTLDPLAEGVMQVAVGRATRLIDYLGSDKKYVAKIKFGYISDTGDAEGEITKVNVPNFTYDELLAALNSLTAEIEQVPPVYSAIKVGGKKLCDLARSKNKKSKTPKNDPNLENPKNAQNQGLMPDTPDFLRENPLHPGENTDTDTLKPLLNHNVTRCGMAQNDTPKTLQIRLDDPSNAEFSGLCTDDANDLCKQSMHISDSNLETKNPPGKIQNDVHNFHAGNDLLSNIKIPKRNVTIYETKVLNFVTNSGEKFSPANESTPSADEKFQISELELEIFCSKGTYIRSFAVDLAAKLNTGAYLTALTRTQAGNFNIENSIKIEEVDLLKHGVNPMLALDLPSYNLTIEEYKLVLNGVGFYGKMPETTMGPQSKQNQTSPEIMLIFNDTLVSIAHLRDNKIVPKKVFK